MGRQVVIRLRLRQDWVWAAAAAVGLVVFSYRTLSRAAGHLPPDYTLEARSAVDALAGGHVGEFLRVAPAYGGSLVLRAPFVLAAKAFGAGDQWLYRASVIPVLLALGALALWLASRMRRAGARWLAALVVVGLCVLNPIAQEAVFRGHAEELLGAVLCVAAVLCALHDRPLWAGVLLGLAIANKEWALLAVGPVLVALPRRRLLSLTWAAAVAGAIIIPFVIAGAINVNHGLQGITGVNTGPVFTQWQVWWFFGPIQTEPGVLIGARSAPGWLAGLAHPLIVGISIPLTLLYVLGLRGRRPSAPDALLLLALLLLLRCVLDPWDQSYYAIPFLIALLAWEALRFRRLPVLALTATLFAWILYVKVPDPSLNLSLDSQALVFLLVSLAATAAIACGLYAPGLRDRLVRRPAHRVNVEPPLEPG